MSKLKPCPFCGGDVNHLEYDYMKYRDWVDFHSAYCFDCEVGFFESTKEKAVGRWNARPSPPKPTKGRPMSRKYRIGLISMPIGVRYALLNSPEGAKPTGETFNRVLTYIRALNRRFL